MMMKFTMLLLFVIAASVVVVSSQPQRPDVDDVPAFARWLVSRCSWGVLSTATKKGKPFGYVASYSDASTGVPFFYLSELDLTARTLKRNRRAAFTVSETEIGTCTTDPQSPKCSKITLTGKLKKLSPSTEEAKVAERALFSRHPEFAGFPKLNGTFAVYKLEIGELFLVNKPAPFRVLPVGVYLSAPAPSPRFV